MGQHSRGAICPRFASTFPLERTEGAGKAGCPEHPQPVCEKMHTVVTTSTPKITRLSPRHGFNGFLRALPGDEFLLVTVAAGLRLTRSGWIVTATDSLAPATGVGTTRFYRTRIASFVLRAVNRSRETRPAITLRADAAASTASHPAFVTTRDPPLLGDEMARAGSADLPDGESKIFFAEGLDDPNHVEISAQNRSLRAAAFSGAPTSRTKNFAYRSY